MDLNLNIWRQNSRQDKGKMVEYKVTNISEDSSFLEMLDILNENLINQGDEPVAFDHDCREGICGMCSLFINGQAHGPDRGITTCQLHMRMFNDGDTIYIEPWRANAYRQDTLSGAFLNKNKYLDKLLKQKCEEDDSLDYDKLWSTIIANDGSVQHLKCLSDYEKDIYKTAMEIDQRWVIEHAADRQEYIDQSQSLNVFFRPDANISYLHAVHFLAWKKQLKTMYYCRSEKIGKADRVSKRIERQIIQELDMSAIAAGEECLACEG